MESKALNISRIILIIITGIALILGVILVFAPTFFITSEFESFTGQALADFAESYPQAYSYILLESSEMGVFLFAVALITLLIILIPYRKGEKWAWYAILISVTLVAIATVGFNIPLGALDIILMSAILVVIDYVALAIGAKSILKKSV